MLPKKPKGKVSQFGACLYYLAQGQFFRILAQAQFIVFEPIMSKLQYTLFRIQKAVESSTVE